MKLEKLSKAELIEYCRELEKVATHNKETASRALVMAESYHAICEKEGLIKTDMITLIEQ